MRTTLSESLARGRNNFDLVRLFAALGVMFGHSYYIDQSRGRQEPISALTGADYSGSLAVYAFFMISGILVTMSYERQKSAINFILLRVARIFPALVFAATLIALVLGPIVSTFGLRAYFEEAQVYRWWFKTTSLVFGVGTYLPGVFTTVDLRLNVDAPVWTLPMELKCYFLVLCAGMLRLTSSRLGIVATCIAAFSGWLYMLSYPDAYYFGDFIIKNVGHSFYPFLCFLIGMLAYAFRNSIILDWRVALGAWALYLVIRQTGAGVVFLQIAFLYSVLTVSALPTLTKFRLPGDYSYGVYLWGFVVQQVFATYVPKFDNLVSLLVTVPLTLAIAVFSWKFVEKPSLGAARRLISEHFAESDVTLKSGG